MSTRTRDAVAPMPALAIAYEPARLDDLLAAPDVLAVIGFAAAPPGALAADPRVLWIDLERLACDSGAQVPAAQPVFEVWRGRGPVASGRDGALCWSRDDDYLFFAIELDESAHGGIEQAAEHAYRTIEAFVASSPMPHFLRVWNYLDSINLGDGDAERYRRFCSGRTRGMGAPLHAGYPAATAIGRRDGRRVLQVYGLASRHAGTAIENPRQVSAWRYPRRYGPASPTFARGMLAPGAQLLISGTAAVVGHASQHQGDIAAQLEETLSNLQSLLDQAGSRPPGLDRRALLKVYLRDAADAGYVVAALRARAPALAGLLVLAGDICRRELLIEIDGLQAFAA